MRAERALGWVLSTAAALSLRAPAAAAAQPGDSKEAFDDDAEPGPTRATAVAVVVDESGRTVTAAVVVRDPLEHGRIRGRHRLHIDADVFGWRRSIPWRDDIDPGTDDNIAEGSAVDSIGFVGGVPALGLPGVGPTGNFGLGYGYGVTDNVVLGLRLGLGFQRLSTAAPDRAATGLFGYWLTPYFEYVFRPGERVRPFVGLRLGVGGSVTADNQGDSLTRIGTVGPTFGASGGVHAFVTERVSIDAALAFDYALMWSRLRIEPPPPMGPARRAFEKMAMVPNLAVVLSLSVWLGRDDR